MEVFKTFTCNQLREVLRDLVMTVQRTDWHDPMTNTDHEVDTAVAEAWSEMERILRVEEGL